MKFTRRQQYILPKSFRVVRHASVLFLLLFSLIASGFLVVVDAAQTTTRVTSADHEVCPRSPVGSEAADPVDLRSTNGLLTVHLTMRSSLDSNGHIRYCYIDQQGNLSPTLRVQPGDTLSIALKNEISLPKNKKPSRSSSKHQIARRTHDPCQGGEMSPAATNLHFHGLEIPPVCHEDDTLKTLIEPGDPPFQYRVHIPKNQAPGLYWYHPHVHGFTEDQVLGGASGAIIVEGMEKVVPRVAGLRQRLFVVRDEKMPEPSASEKVDPNRPTKQLTVNNVPVPYPQYPAPTVRMKPLDREFWRVLNASADTYLDIGVEYGGKRQGLELVALDGVPLRYGEPGAPDYAPQQTHIFLPPASRAEFTLTGPPPGATGHLATSFVFRGASDDDKPVATKSPTQPALRVGLDDVDSARPLAVIVPSDTVSATIPRLPSITPDPPPAPLSSVRPVRKRKLYFSEKLVDPSDPNSATLFFITEEGHEPKVFDPGNSDATITVQQGTVEDWTIENRSRESHVFHVHQLHFIVVGGITTRWEEPTARDTIDVPAWDGFRKYPYLVLRMDFRDPAIIGTFPFHCHIMQHVDGGMMGIIRVVPADSAATVAGSH
ncbi:MAG TPA: multicopper oxidase domain-containing protein [Terriglobales bacterium]|nr:multicopper oxidase domain-containing protein [Terriglobales bacterium]